VILPYQTYRRELSEAMRKHDPIDGLVIPTVVAIVVLPSQIDSPDIVKIIVERDGQVVPPLQSDLGPKPFLTRMGGSKMVNAGTVVYQCSVFAPGATVTVTVVPDYGRNIINTFTTSQLVDMK
jgi:hypothetical protein